MIGGAGDPNSGSAIMIELSKALAKLVASGWKPKRNMFVPPSKPSKVNGNDKMDIY